MTKAVIFDIDGTLADLSHRLHHIQNGSHDWDGFFAACGGDTVIEPIRDLAVLVARQGLEVVLVSGRSDAVRAETEQWLGRNGVTYSALHMRRAGDYRQDFIVKSQILDGMTAAALAKGGRVRYIVIDRPTDEKRRDAGWRAELPFDLIAKHEQTFGSQIKDILRGDGQSNVEVIDLRRAS